MRAWAIARVELVRLLRDRSNVFFVFVFPLLLVVLIGAQFGDEDAGAARLGVVHDPTDTRATALVGRLGDAQGVSILEVEDEATVRDEVLRGALAAGVVVPAGYGDSLRDVDDVEVRYVAGPEVTGTSLRAIVDAAVADDAAAGTAARLAAAELDLDATPTELRGVAEQLGGQLPGVEVTAETLGTDELAEEFAGLGRFDLGASSQLFLFTFLTSLSGGAALIQTRQYGIARRMLSTPTTVSTMVAGQAGGRLLVALLQAGYIVVATLLLFGVNWGEPLASTVVIGSFCLVSAAAGLLLGATFRNDSQAAGAGVGLGLGLAALGGSMVPLELFPDTMRTIARITPHAWANEAMAELVRRDAGLTDVLPQVGALLVFAVVLLASGTRQLLRTLSR